MQIQKIMKIQIYKIQRNSKIQNHANPNKSQNHANPNKSQNPKK
jgi:hypothetical protein